MTRWGRHSFVSVLGAIRMGTASSQYHSTPAASQPVFLRTWLLWTVGFVAFPIAGIAGDLVAGRVDDAAAALLGGVVTGAVLGTGQVLASRRRLDPRTWIPATTIGMGAGLLLGAATVGYGTSLGELVLMGALTGVVLGVAQTLALPARTHRRWVWAAALPILWALGWAVTTLGGVSVENQFTIYGSFGAVTFSALSGLLLNYLLPYQAEAGPAPTQTGIETEA